MANTKKDEIDTACAALAQLLQPRPRQEDLRADGWRSAKEIWEETPANMRRDSIDATAQALSRLIKKEPDALEVIDAKGEEHGKVIRLYRPKQ